MATVCCFLCNADVSRGTMKTKRKRLTGESTRKAVGVLDMLSSSNYEKKFSILFKDESYLCYKCQKRVEDLPELLKKAENEKKDIIQLIGRHFPDSIPSICRKRTSEELETDAQPSSSKHIAVGETTPTRVGSGDRPSLDSSTPSRSIIPSRFQDKQDVHVSVKVGYPSGAKNVDVNSPWGKENVKRIIRKSYTSLSSSVVSSPRTADLVISKVCHSIHKEMKNICSLSHDSIIRDSHEGVKHFSWQTIWLELLHHMPTLMKFLSALLPDTDHKSNRNILCLIACMLLKKRLNKMSLVQRAVSIVLYGNGCSKQVFNCLQPLMVCLSHTGTLRLVERISSDYDMNVQLWSDELLENLKERLSQPSPVQRVVHFCYDVDHTEEIELDSQVQYEEFEAEDDDDGDSVMEDDREEITDDIDDEQCLNVMVEIMNEDVSVESEECQQENCTKNQHVSQADAQYIGNIDADSRWNGFKIVGDNIDKNFRRSFQRIDYQTRSFHYFHSYAVLDRVNLGTASDLPKPGVVDLMQVLPTKEELKQLKQSFSILISRVLCKHVEKFKNEGSSVLWHIPHEASSHMAKKSEIVPLGIQLHNENKVDEMCQILDELHRYVPALSKEEAVTLPNGDVMDDIKTDMWEILFGGDQLTVARVRGSRAIRANHHSSVDKLQGLLPTIEDWHTRMTFMKVIWKRLFSRKSGSAKGTLFQIKNLIHRTAVPNDPEDNMNAAEDFMEVVLEAYIVAAAHQLMQSQLDGSLTEISDSIVNAYVRILPEETPGLANDEVYTYTCEFLSLGLLWWNYLDATREGDGGRVMVMWKILMLIFKKTGHRNYAKEAALLLVQYHFFLSERKAKQIKFSRFVNTQGRQGCNIPCDLHMEHLNRRLKGVIRHMGSNIQPPSLVRAAKSIGVVDDICNVFERESRGKKQSGHHAKLSFTKDYDLIMKELTENRVCQMISARSHASLSLKRCLLDSIDKENILDWLLENVVPGILYS